MRIQTGEKEDSWSCSYRGCTAAAAAALLAVGRSQADLSAPIHPEPRTYRKSSTSISRCRSVRFPCRAGTARRGNGVTEPRIEIELDPPLGYIEGELALAAVIVFPAAMFLLQIAVAELLSGLGERHFTDGDVVRPPLDARGRDRTCR